MVALAFTFAFATFALATFALRFVSRVLTLALALVLLVDLRLSAMNRPTRPTPITNTASSPPSIHQIALDRFGRVAGTGAHCWGGGGGAVGLGLGAAGAAR